MNIIMNYIVDFESSNLDVNKPLLVDCDNECSVNDPYFIRLSKEITQQLSEYIQPCVLILINNDLALSSYCEEEKMYEIFINPVFFRGFAHNEIKAIIAHEIAHRVHRHLDEVDREESFLREYQADKDSVLFGGNYKDLISALYHMAELRNCLHYRLYSDGQTHPSIAHRAEAVGVDITEVIPLMSSI